LNSFGRRCAGQEAEAGSPAVLVDLAVLGNAVTQKYGIADELQRGHQIAIVIRLLTVQDSHNILSGR